MKVTLITACYNSVATIRTAMESVAEQRGVEVDYIVVDGGSTDGTVSLLQEFEAKIGNGERGPGNGERGTGTGEQGTGNGFHSDGFPSATRACMMPSTRVSRWRLATLSAY